MVRTLEVLLEALGIFLVIRSPRHSSSAITASVL
jgi:hypothetical protein